VPVLTTHAAKSLSDVTNRIFAEVVQQNNMQIVGEQLREHAVNHGLGVALLIAGQHGLNNGHIPLKRDETSQPLQSQVTMLPAEPYVFANVSIRDIRGNNSALISAGIMNAQADPTGLFYHEDALVSSFSFDIKALQSRGLLQHPEDITKMLAALASQQILVEANVNNRQIQFKDLDSKRFLESSAAKVYVLVEQNLGKAKFWLPSFGLSSADAAVLRDHILTVLRTKRPCNYCSVHALNPREATLHSRQLASTFGTKHAGPATRRNYQFGYTFAPFGDPRDVCHFLAWDFPHISDTVLNMDPQAYSFADLIELVRVINADIARFAQEHGIEDWGAIAGICNHWAGNSIYHQHYQFFHLAGIPLLQCLHQKQALAEYHGVTVSRLQWGAPAYVITATEEATPSDFAFVAERVALEWSALNGPDEYDTSFGNGIKIKHHTQNTYVTTLNGSLIAVFIPRHRSKLGTFGSGNKVQKRAVGVLEMMGYFLVDEPEFTEIGSWPVAERSFLAAAWLRELAPDHHKIRQFEMNLHERLSGVVVMYERRLDDCLKHQDDNVVFAGISKLRTDIDNDGALEPSQQGYLRRRVSDAYNQRAGRPIL
jgi:hypothetical protein